MAFDQDKARSVQLSFKKATEGLNSEEQKELEDLGRKLAIQGRMQQISMKEQ